ncbi:SLC13 family permease [Leptothrix discophora]|uniref:SLC13 family permease n=1 Tax=Leptothrix discophora TaxID=89 RepID=A0ABT9FZM6_LEPDI|nr:SLC13 family permease [Leptothrix discophora]MDP4299403.1 SLC13 family permease [Leptothrix discophora]
MTPAQDVTVLVFALVYLGMVLGGLPFLQLDRTGVALLGAIALIGGDVLSMQDAAQAVHVPTVILLFAFMVVSAQMRLGGFYDWATRRLAALPLSPAELLGALIVVSAVLSAVFSNDIVCLAVAPVLVDAARRRGLNPLPLLLALACASNIGSAATLIGNPQNMLVGETLKLDFAGHVRDATPPVLLALGLTWAIVAWLFRGRWTGPVEAGTGVAEIAFDRWQTAKGLGVALGIVACFLLTDWPREVIALTGAGLLLLSRKLHSRDMLGLIDYELLLLFIGLFIVNHAFEATGLPQQAVDALARAGIALADPAPLAITTFGLSNLVSNVPAVMLLLPHATHALAGLTLTLVSTLAGNLLIVGSIANIIVVDAAQRRGVAIDWRTHARVGVPVTLGSLAVTGLWLAWLA